MPIVFVTVLTTKHRISVKLNKLFTSEQHPHPGWFNLLKEFRSQDLNAKSVAFADPFLKSYNTRNNSIWSLDLACSHHFTASNLALMDSKDIHHKCDLSWAHSKYHVFYFPNYSLFPKNKPTRNNNTITHVLALLICFQICFKKS